MVQADAIIEALSFRAKSALLSGHPFDAVWGRDTMMELARVGLLTWHSTDTRGSGVTPLGHAVAEALRAGRTRLPRAKQRTARDVGTARPPLEKHEQANTLKVLRSLGGKVYVIGTRRPKGTRCPKCQAFVPESQSTRQTAGIPDVLVFLKHLTVEGRRVMVWIEQKARGKGLSPEQREFRDLCLAAGIEHTSGTCDQVVEYLTAGGYLRRRT